MKNLIKTLLIFAFIMPVTFLFAGCAKTYQIEYYVNGSWYKTVNVKSDESVFREPGPKQNGYIFDGWYLSETGDEKFDFSKYLDRNVKLYARYNMASYAVIYHNMDGATNNPNNKTSFDITTPTFILHTEGVTKTGYTFDGWYSDPLYVIDKTHINQGTHEDVHLYAKWNPNQYTITFVSNGGSEVASITAGYQTGINKPDNPTKEGYAFVGWYTDNGTFEHEYDFTTMPLGGATLYAKWTAANQTITFNSNGGSEVADLVAPYGSAIEAPENPEHDGYSFGGWYTDNNTFENQFEFDTMPLGGATLYAKWNLNQYTITYELDGGTNNANNPATYTYDSATITLQDPTKTGYTFAGWYVGADQVTQIAHNSHGEITLTAHWTATPYTINYHLDSDAGEQNNANNPATYDIETAVSTLAAPTKVVDSVVYTFLGWFTDEDCTEAFAGIAVGSTGAKDVYAKWQVSVGTAEELQNAAAQKNVTILLTDDIELSTDQTSATFLTLANKSVLDGQGHIITLQNINAFTAQSYGITIKNEAQLKNLTLIHDGELSGSTMFMAVALYPSAKNVVIEDVTINMPFVTSIEPLVTDLSYRFAIYSWANDKELTISGSDLIAKYVLGVGGNGNTITINDSTAAAGWSVVSTYGKNNTINISDSVLSSTNVTTTGGDASNMYAMFWFRGGLEGYEGYDSCYNNTINVENTQIVVEGNANAHQAIAGASIGFDDSEIATYGDITNVVNLKAGTVAVLNDYALVEYHDIKVNIISGTYNFDPQNGKRIWTWRGQSGNHKTEVDTHDYLAANSIVDTYYMEENGETITVYMAFAEDERVVATTEAELIAACADDNILYITLDSDIELSARLNITNRKYFNGNNHKLSGEFNSNFALFVRPGTEDDVKEVVIKNLTLMGNETNGSGNVYGSYGLGTGAYTRVELLGVTVFGYRYALSSLYGTADIIAISSSFTGYAAVLIDGVGFADDEYSGFMFVNCELHGVNAYNGTDNNWGTIVFNPGAKWNVVELVNTEVYAEASGTASQAALLWAYGSEFNNVHVYTEDPNGGFVLTGAKAYWFCNNAAQNGVFDINNTAQNISNNAVIGDVAVDFERAISGVEHYYVGAGDAISLTADVELSNDVVVYATTGTITINLDGHSIDGGELLIANGLTVISDAEICQLVLLRMVIILT